MLCLSIGYRQTLLVALAWVNHCPIVRLLSNPLYNCYQSNKDNSSPLTNQHEFTLAKSCFTYCMQLNPSELHRHLKNTTQGLYPICYETFNCSFTVSHDLSSPFSNISYFSIQLVAIMPTNFNDYSWKTHIHHCFLHFNTTSNSLDIILSSTQLLLLHKHYHDKNLHLEIIVDFLNLGNKNHVITYCTYCLFL